MIFLKNHFWIRIIIFFVFFTFASPSASRLFSRPDSGPFSCTIFQHFKAVLMYFSETFLSNSKFGNYKLEGESDHLIMETRLSRAIDKVVKIEGERHGADARMERLRIFNSQLKAGIEVRKIGIKVLASSYSSLKKQSSRFTSEALKLQSAIVSGINRNDGIVFPAGWLGHSIVLIIKTSESAPPGSPLLYDLTVVNSGEGLGHHYQRADPDNIYPHLSRLWLEFKNIPSDLIFHPENAWFLCGLILINLPDFVNDANLSASNYFYDSLLANFRDFLVEPKEHEIDEKLVPEQKSDSCTMSGLVAALLYFSDSLKAYHWYRLKIGHVLLNDFLTRFTEMNSRKSMTVEEMEFTMVFTDGFFYGGLNFFKGLIRSLASQQLQYLEHEFPEEFKHAGLIGPGRSAWIHEKMGTAMEKLSRQEQTLNELSVTISLAKRVHDIASNTQFRHETTHIPDRRYFMQTESVYTVQQRAPNSEKWDHAENLEFDLGSVSRGIFKGNPDRFEVDGQSPIYKFQDFYNCFKEFYYKSDDDRVVYFIRFLDLFYRLHSGSSWSLIMCHREKHDLLELQDICKNLAAKFVKLANDKIFTDQNRRKPTLDEITLLGHLQLLSWNLFKTLQEIMFPKLSYRWDQIIPPQSVQSVILEYQEQQHMFISGHLRIWPITGFNDIKNYQLFQLFIRDGQSESTDFLKSYRSTIIPFPGPEYFEISSAPFINFPYGVYEKLKNNSFLFSEIFDHFAELEEVEEVLNKLKRQDGYKKFWSKCNQNYAKMLIIFGIKSELFQSKIPHFYNLMHTLRSLIMGASSVGGQCDNNCGFAKYMEKHDSFEYLCKSRFYCLKRKNIYEFDYPIYYLANFSSRDLFYVFRHLQTFPEQIEMTDVDTWFNYIKNARAAIVFDEPYFQYMTDHLLNIPKYPKGSHKLLFLFDEEKAQNIILALIRLVQLSIKELYDNSGKIGGERRGLIISRVVNISVITTRFISRADCEIDNSETWSILLARLYNIINQMFSLKSPTFLLKDSDVSSLNLALGHMCSTHISNPQKFIESINLGFDWPYDINKNTLAKLHWFISKMNYTISTPGSIADDQFNHGFLGSPIEQKEHGFFEEFLRHKFLKTYLKEEFNVSFTYDSAGYVIEMSYATSKIEINIATGIVLENGAFFASNSTFTESREFRTFFGLKDQKYLNSAGKVIFYSDVMVFVLPPLRGINYLMIHYKGSFWILREWNNDVYVWRPDNACSDFFDALDYNWQGQNIKLFKKYKFDEKSTELIIFEEDCSDPFIQVTKNAFGKVNATFSLCIPGFSNINSASIVNKDDFIEMHIKNFSEGGITFASCALNRSFVIVIHNYRLPEQPSKPLVFALSQEGILNVENIPNMEICKDQRIGKECLSLPGTLIASMGEKKVLLLPFTEVLTQSKANTPPTSYDYAYIEKIPIITESIGTRIYSMPVPQTRKHKLLLAYFLILAQNFGSACNFLHPDSIHQNEMFSKDELQIITWIMRINCNHPEFIALNLFCHFHILINEAKFTFEIDQITAKLIENITDQFSSKLFETYLMSVRDLSDKYYIHKLFPEILSEDSLFSTKEFYSFSAARNLKKLSKAEKSFYFSSPNCGFGKRINIAGFMDYLKGDCPGFIYNSLKFLIIRNSGAEKFDKNLEMAVYCYAMRPDLWADFKMAIEANTNNLRDSNGYFMLADSLNRIISTCSSEFGSAFDGISLNRFSTSTDPEKIKEAMREDLRLGERIENGIFENSIKLVTDMEIEETKSIKSKLMNRIMGSREIDNNTIKLGFDPALTEKSEILKSLSKSIGDFISETRQNQLKYVDFHDEAELFSELFNFNESLKLRIVDLFEHQELLVQVLTAKTYLNIDDDPISNRIERLFSLMHQSKQKTFSDLYSCYLKDSLYCIQSKFPQLSPDHCRKVKDDSVLFFSQQILLDYLRMLHNSAETFISSSNPVPLDNLLIFCDELDKVFKFNDRLKNPVIMNFEFRSRKYRLKTEQVDDIELLTSESSDSKNYTSVVIQRMMAAGKTLVLGTISVVMKALKNNNRLSILVPPSSLYQSNTTDMQSRTYQLFKKSGNTFSFTRLPLPTDAEIADKVLNFLSQIINLIERTMKNRNYLIVSPDHLQSFLNSFVEAIDGAATLGQGANRDLVIIILKKFATIYKIFKDRSSVILDEIDMTMDPKKELNFSTTETESYNMTAAAMIADIIEFMVFDRSIRKAGLNIHSNNQMALTPEGYSVCQEIVLNYIETQLYETSSLWHQFVAEDKREHVVEFLKTKRLSVGKEWILEMYQSGDEVLAKALIIVKTQINLYLEQYLSGTVNQNYGGAGKLRPEIKFAVPYAAANTPSSGSVFADRWETLIKTLLMISASPCSIEITKDIIKYVRIAIYSESANNAKSKIKDLPMFEQMTMVVSNLIDISSLDETNYTHVEVVHAGLIRRSPAAVRIIFSYYINEIMAKMEFPVEQITSNALHMTSMFSSIQGYSGTIDNVNVLPQKVVENALKDHENNEKNNGGIALKLIQDFNNAVVPELMDESFSKSILELVRDVFGAFHDNEYFELDQVSAIIDTGAFFKNFKNKNVAEAILQFYAGRIEAVVYYDESTNQLEFMLISGSIGRLETSDPNEIERATHTKIGKRFTFYDQRHITGSDILQPKSAHAIMTAHPRVLLRDILQGTLRMRQFMTSQSLHLLISESVRNFYNSKIMGVKDTIKVSDILTLGALNEDEKQVHENEKLAFSKIDAEVRSFILDEICEILLEPSSNQVDINRVTRMFNENRDLYIRSIKEDPFSWLCDKELQSTAELLDQYAKLKLEGLRPFFTTIAEISRFNDLKNRLELMYANDRSDSLLNHLKSEIRVRTSETVGSEVLIHTQVNTLILTNLDLLVQKIDGLVISKKHTDDLIRECYIDTSDNNIQDNKKSFLSLKKLFDSQDDFGKLLTKSVILTEGNQIGVTMDLVELFDNVRSSENKFPIFSKYTLEGTHLLVYASKEQADRPHVLLISASHAAKAYQDIGRYQAQDHLCWLCDLSGDVSITSSSNSVKNILEVSELGEDFKRLVFDLLIFNGSLPQILFNPKLKQIYENEWLASEHAQDRAIFLRYRMKVLCELNYWLFEEGDSEYTKLIKVSLNGVTKEEEIKEIVGTSFYSKNHINMEVQTDFGNNLSLSTFEPLRDNLQMNLDYLTDKFKSIFESVNRTEVFENDYSITDVFNRTFNYFRRFINE